MTKKDYILIADILKNKYECVKTWKNDNCQSLALAYIEDFIKMLEANNPAFNRSKFISYINK